METITETIQERLDILKDYITKCELIYPLTCHEDIDYNNAKQWLAELKNELKTNKNG